MLINLGMVLTNMIISLPISRRTASHLYLNQLAFLSDREEPTFARSSVDKISYNRGVTE